MSELDRNKETSKAPTQKRSLRSVAGALKSPLGIDIDEAIEFTRSERATEIVNRLKESTSGNSGE